MKGRERPENILERAYVFIGAPGSSTIMYQNLCDVTQHQLTLICSVLGIPEPVVEYTVGNTGPSSSQNLLVFCFLVPCTWFSTLGGGLCGESVPVHPGRGAASIHSHLPQL